MRLKILLFVLVTFLFLNNCSYLQPPEYRPEKPAAEEEAPPPEEAAEPIELKKKAAPAKKTTRSAALGRVFQTGIASWYGPDFHGKRTANGEIYDMHKMTAAHKKLPFNTLVQVENLDNGRHVVVRINDRGPFVKDRIIDLSFKAAQQLGSYEDGVAPVTLRIVKPGAVRVGSSTNAGAPATPGRAQTLEKEVVTETAASNTTASPPPPPVTSPPADPDVTSTPVSPPPPPPSDHDPDFPKVKYYLQAGAFSVSRNAEKMLRNIKLILPNTPFNFKLQDGLYKVISGPMQTREEAERVRKILLDIDIEAFIKEL